MSKEKFLTSLDGNSFKISDKKGNVVADNIVLVFGYTAGNNYSKEKTREYAKRSKAKKERLCINLGMYTQLTEEIIQNKISTLINDEEIKGESDYEIPAAENTTVEKSATINTNTTATQPIKSNPPSKKETTNKEGQKPKAIFPVKKKN